LFFHWSFEAVHRDACSASNAGKDDSSGLHVTLDDGSALLVLATLAKDDSSGGTPFAV
jgi:hypothetical protein